MRLRSHLGASFVIWVRSGWKSLSRPSLAFPTSVWRFRLLSALDRGSLPFQHGNKFLFGLSMALQATRHASGHVDLSCKRGIPIIFSVQG